MALLDEWGPERFRSTSAAGVWVVEREAAWPCESQVIYAPFRQMAFSTVALTGGDWLLATAVASGVLWVSEAMKWANRAGIVRVA